MAPQFFLFLLLLFFLNICGHVLKPPFMVKSQKEKEYSFHCPLGYADAKPFLSSPTVPTKNKKRSKKFLGVTEVSTRFCEVFVTQESWKSNISTGSFSKNPTFRVLALNNSANFLILCNLRSYLKLIISGRQVAKY